MVFGDTSLPSASLRMPLPSKRYLRISKLSLERLGDIWVTLSENTRLQALKRAKLYEPKELEWDDPRSNRYPV